jgi:hypothetical protein
MAIPTDNETWVIEAGDKVIQKKATMGAASLAPWEMLVYCLWVADHGMRNAGDLKTAADVYADFQSDARRIAEALSLRVSLAAFSLTQGELEQAYFDRFESLCDEIRRAEPDDVGSSAGS